MSFHRLPTPNLAFILAGQPAAQEIAAVPLKPPAGIVRIYPAFGSPDAEWLAGTHAKKIQTRITPGRNLGRSEPFFGEFVRAIGHVLAPEYTEP
jgi:hypothetical protein